VWWCSVYSYYAHVAMPSSSYSNARCEKYMRAGACRHAESWQAAGEGVGSRRRCCSRRRKCARAQPLYTRASSAVVNCRTLMSRLFITTIRLYEKSIAWYVGQSYSVCRPAHAAHDGYCLLFRRRCPPAVPSPKREVRRLTPHVAPRMNYTVTIRLTDGWRDIIVCRRDASDG